MRNGVEKSIEKTSHLLMVPLVKQYIVYYNKRRLSVRLDVVVLRMSMEGCAVAVLPALS